MGKSISLLSGKGGSGKTTLSLTIAHLLASCGLKVLLVDCDLFTNGATYFYENRLGGNKSILSFYSILYDESIAGRTPITITPSLDFIPSIQRITEEVTVLRPYTKETCDHFQERTTKLKEQYEVLLFDCPAGYSDIVRYVAPSMDQNLIVLEADTISMAAMRSLFLKLGTQLPEARFYQIYNKIHGGEIEKYLEKDGTFYQNIGAIAFDWAIPDAFSDASVPTVDRAGVDFGMQLYTVCSRLFQGDRYQKRLQHFHARLMLSKAEEERDQVRQEMLEYRPARQSRHDILEMLIQIFLTAFPPVALMYFMTTTPGFSTSDSLTLSAILMTLFIPNLLFTMNRHRQDSLLRRSKLSIYTDKLKDLDKKIKKLEQEYERTMPKRSVFMDFDTE